MVEIALKFEDKQSEDPEHLVLVYEDPKTKQRDFFHPIQDAEDLKRVKALSTLWIMHVHEVVEKVCADASSLLLREHTTHAHLHVVLRPQQLGNEVA